MSFEVSFLIAVGSEEEGGASLRSRANERMWVIPIADVLTLLGACARLLAWSSSEVKTSCFAGFVWPATQHFGGSFYGRRPESIGKYQKRCGWGGGGAGGLGFRVRV